MADTSLDVHRMAREQENRIAATAAIGINAAMPFVQFQTSMLRILAENFESTAATMREVSKRLVSSSNSSCRVNSEECGADRTRRRSFSPKCVTAFQVNEGRDE